MFAPELILQERLLDANGEGSQLSSTLWKGKRNDGGNV